VKRHHPSLRAGDCYLHNSPYEGNSHAADHCLIAPIIDKDGVLRFFALAKAHQADCGNSRPSTYLADVADVYEEGALIFSAVKIQQNYRNNEDIGRMCRNRIRVPEQSWGDYLASLGAVRIAERELLALGEEIGWDTLERYAEAWFDYSEGKMIEAIRRLTSGRATMRAAHDPIPGLPNGIAIKVGGGGRRRRRRDRGRSDGQSRLPTLRPQPDPGHRQHSGDGRHLQFDSRSHSANQCRQLPAGDAQTA
jgi:N-methylhydantoinase B